MRSLVPALQLAARAAVAAAVSVVLARLAGLPFPIYAMIAAVIVTDLEAITTRRLAWQRMAGTIAGAVLGAIACRWLPAQAATLALAIFIAMLGCHALGMKDAAKLAGYVSAIVVLEHAGDPWLYALNRLLETALGIAVALGLSLVPKLLRVEARQPPAR